MEIHDNHSSVSNFIHSKNNYDLLVGQRQTIWTLVFCGILWHLFYLPTTTTSRSPYPIFHCRQLYLTMESTV